MLPENRLRYWQWKMQLTNQVNLQCLVSDRIPMSLYEKARGRTGWRGPGNEVNNTALALLPMASPVRKNFVSISANLVRNPPPFTFRCQKYS